ncbi:MAG TPA: WYL domain-containing protein [Clostridiaceae bacterium]
MEGSKSRSRLLNLLDILYKKSDEDNTLTMGSIIEELEKQGITAERKAVYKDIKELMDFGYDISTFEENRKGYFMRSREFDETEIRFLMDAILSSRCLTTKKSKDLSQKLLHLTSESSASRLKNRVTFEGRIKCHNEEFYYNIDKINRAISENKKITYQYYEYDFDKNLVLKMEGYIYTINPYDLCWNEDFYYLIGSHDKYDNLSNYRVDRMHDIKIIDEKRKEIYKVSGYDSGLNLVEYIRRSFKMFSGDKTKVEIKFSRDLLNTIIDRMGVDVTIRKLGGTHFKLSADVNIGEGFLAWILGFGTKAEVLYPDFLRETIKEKIEELRELY